MEYKEEYLIISKDAEILLNESYSNYVAHLICLQGTLTFIYNENEFNCMAGNGLICIPGRFTEVSGTPDLAVKIVLTHIDFHFMATPQSNYGVQGTLSLFLNPIISLNEKEFELLVKDMDEIEYRIQNTQLFRQDVLQCATQMMFLDYFQPHARVVSDEQINAQTAAAMMRFIGILSTGAYKKHREVAWYASEMCVTPKYLSEITQKCSGASASYWIQRFTTTEIHRSLKNQNIPITDIIDEFCFSSASHFTRYVVQHLGKKPTDFRS